MTVRNFAQRSAEAIMSSARVPDQPDVQPYAAITKLVHAAIALTSLQPLDQVLQTLVDTARDIVDARYAALGVIDPATSRLGEFVTSGVTAAERDGLKRHPAGHGLLGLLIRDPQPVRLANLADHPDSAGLPDGHPPMRSFMGLPIVARERVFGNLYVTEKLNAHEFAESDLMLLQMLAALAASAVENAQLRQERDRFFAAASHELGNAVAGVRLWAEHLSSKMQPDAPTDLMAGLQHIRKGADNAHRLIDDLLSLARIQEGKLKLAPWPVDVSALLLEVLEQHAPEILKADLSVDVSAVAPAIITEADSARLRQIFVNLMSNALKFSAPGTAISVGVKRDDGKVRAWVADRGPGVAPSDVERIFRPYEQVSGLARGRGAGLGLPLSRQLARIMGGELWVEDAAGGGAVFIVALRA
jgi:signal transduction histidine kinase